MLQNLEKKLYWILDEIHVRKPLTKSTISSTKSFYQNQQNLVSCYENSWLLAQKISDRQIHKFCWILEKVVFLSEMPLFVGSYSFEFPDPFALFTSFFSTVIFLSLILISENASFPLITAILWTGIFSKNSWNFLVSNFGDRQISEICQFLEEISFSREMRHFIRPWYFEIPDPFNFFTANFV